MRIPTGTTRPGIIKKRTPNDPRPIRRSFTSCYDFKAMTALQKCPGHAGSQYFGVSIDYLTGKTDIKNPPDQQSPEEIAKVALFGGDGEVTDEMWNEVKGFVEFIKDKRKRENDNN